MVIYDAEKRYFPKQNALHNPQIIDQLEQGLLSVPNVRIQKHPKTWPCPEFCTNRKFGRNFCLVGGSDLTAGASDSSNWMLASMKIHCDVRFVAVSDVNKATACTLVGRFLSGVRIYPTTHGNISRDNNPQSHCTFDIPSGNEIRDKDLTSNGECKKWRRNIQCDSKRKKNLKKTLYITSPLAYRL